MKHVLLAMALLLSLASHAQTKSGSCAGELGKIQPANAVYASLFPNSVPDKAEIAKVFGLAGPVDSAYLVHSPETSLQYVVVTQAGQTRFFQASVEDGKSNFSEAPYSTLGTTLAMVHHPAGVMQIDPDGKVHVTDIRRANVDSGALDPNLTYHKNRKVDLTGEDKHLKETDESMNCYVPRRLGKSFANINFVGPCNMRCTFCIGNTGSENKAMLSMDTRKIKAEELPNIRPFLQKMKDEKVPWIMLTGLNTEPLLYEDLEALIELIHSYGLKAALRSNALTALKRMDTINRMDKATYSLHTLNPDTSQKLLGVRTIPDWENILKETKIPVKINIVACPENKDEIPSILDKLSKWGVKRVSLRNPFGYWGIPREDLGEPTGWYANNPIHTYKGMEVTLWETSETTVDSYNYVAGNGEILDEYGIFDVIKGIGAPANAKRLELFQQSGVQSKKQDVIQLGMDRVKK